MSEKLTLSILIITTAGLPAKKRRKMMFIKTLGALKLLIKTVSGLVKPQARPTFIISVPKSTSRDTVAVV